MYKTSEMTSSPVHFTYNPHPDFNNLCQGDILQITPDLKGVLETVHPYFIQEQYKYFIVLTQSCDLVRRDGQNCKSAYISLAAVRDFNSFFEKEFVHNKHYAKKVNSILLMDSDVKDRAVQLIERIYNNTEPDYFFLYKEEALGFPSSMIAYLKVSFTLKTSENYSICLSAKLLELSEEFKAKLGWLVGNIYSRVGTVDWDSILTKEEKNERFQNEIQSRCIVGGKTQLKQLEKELKNHSISTLENARDYIAQVHIETNYDKAMKTIEELINQRNNLDERERMIIINLIRSNSVLKRIIKPEI